MSVNNSDFEIMTVCFTGHRSIPKEYAFLLPGLLKREIEKLIDLRSSDFS